ncbi:MAG: queuosine precursor transporter [Peptococcaceae bacterium]|nr:queuosine precursor transporter [Peptococcaceae bacterium]
MHNEILLIATLLAVFGAILLSYVLFAEKGLIAWVILAAITANIEVLILIRAFSMEQTLGNIMFASTFLATDIISELHGKKQAKQAVNIGIFISLCFLLISQSWLQYRPSPDDQFYPFIQGVFTNTPRVLISSLAVYAIVQRFDVWLYHRLWQFTENSAGSTQPFLWLRNSSTLISQLLNTILFTFLAFWGTYSLPTLISIIISTYVIYIVISLTDTPIVYLARFIAAKKRRPSPDP